MIQFAYTIAESERRKLASEDAAQLLDMDLHYGYADGVIRLTCGDTGAYVELDNPVLDFAIVMQRNVADLKTAATAEFECTESTEAIIFQREGDEVTISHNISRWSCTCTFAELQAITDQFLEDVLRDLSAIAPSLMEHEYVQRVLTEDPATKWWS